MRAFTSGLSVDDNRLGVMKKFCILSFFHFSKIIHLTSKYYLENVKSRLTNCRHSMELEFQVEHEVEHGPDPSTEVVVVVAADTEVDEMNRARVWKSFHLLLHACAYKSQILYGMPMVTDYIWSADCLIIQ